MYSPPVQKSILKKLPNEFCFFFKPSGRDGSLVAPPSAPWSAWYWPWSSSMISDTNLILTAHTYSGLIYWSLELRVHEGNHINERNCVSTSIFFIKRGRNCFLHFFCELSFPLTDFQQIGVGKVEQRFNVLSHATPQKGSL